MDRFSHDLNRNNVEEGANRNSIEAGANRNKTEADANGNSIEADADRNSIEAGADRNSIEAGANRNNIEVDAIGNNVEAGEKNKPRYKKSALVVGAIAGALVLLIVIGIVSDWRKQDVEDGNLPATPTQGAIAESDAQNSGNDTQGVNEDIRTEVIEVEGEKEEIQTKRFISTNGYSLYYDFERYNVSEKDGEVAVYPKDDPDMLIASMTISHVKNIAPEDELRKRMEAATKIYTKVENTENTITLNNGEVLENGFRAVHDDENSDLWSMDDYVMYVWCMSDEDSGTYVLAQKYIMEAAEGHGARLMYMAKSFEQ